MEVVMKNLTIRDIAKICGVGISTVSRAINNDPTINEKTKERVLKVIKEYNYVPNNSARNLKMTESNTIALLIKGIDNQFFQGMLSVFQEELKKIKYQFIIRTVAEDEDDASVAIELTKEKRLKGIIFLGGLMDYPEESLKATGIPYVLCTVAVNKDAPKRKCSSVAIDDEEESYKATKYLLSKGHKKIAMIAGRESDYAVGRMRLEGYRKALEEEGLEYDPELVGFMKEDIPEYTLANGYAVMSDLLEAKKDEFTAVYCVSDITACGAYKAIYDKGYSIPDDYSVLGFDGIELGKYLVPSLTTIKQPSEEMVKSSIKHLMREIEGKESNVSEILKGELIERGSIKEI